MVARLAGRLTPEQIKRLNTHVDEEERARGNDEPLSIRLATEFHILLAEMTGSPVLTRYVSENASRCGLDACALQPSAFVGMCRQRAPRHHCGVGQGRCEHARQR